MQDSPAHEYEGGTKISLHDNPSGDVARMRELAASYLRRNQFGQALFLSQANKNGRYF